MNNKISKVYLLNTPLEKDYKNTLYFNSKANQQSYFESCIVKSYNDFSYQRKDNFIRVPDHFDDLQNVNYVMYQNTSYSNKWFYAFITELKYIDDGRTDIYIETDYMQTWLFDYILKPSFVEREHVNNDTIGIHTVPESLETGDYIINSVNKNVALTDTVIVLASTIDPTIQNNELVGGSVGGGVYNGVRSGFKYYTFNNNTSSSLTNVLKAFAEAGKSDAIGMMFVAPKKLINVAEAPNYDNGMVTESNLVNGFTWGDSGSDEVNTKPTTLNGYTPHNNKLLTYPYTFLNISNNNGGNAVYKYELFNSTNCDFDIYGALTPSMDIIIVPKNYNGATYNYHEALQGGKFPICGWATDVYTNWLTQNAINIGVSLGSSALQMVGGFAMLGTGAGALMGAGSIGSGASSIANTLGEMYKHSLVPIQAEGNVNTGNVKFATNNTTFTAYKMTIKNEYAQIIDKYFDMFGYKVNMVKQPNTHHRSRWWYTKTIDVNIDGAIPNKDMDVIKNCYNNGITFWRNASEIQNYGLSNAISNIV